MELQKKTIIIATILAILSLGGGIFTKETLQIILLSLFTGMLVSFVFSLTNYFHEKKKFIDLVYNINTNIYMYLLAALDTYDKNTALLNAGRFFIVDVSNNRIKVDNQYIKAISQLFEYAQNGRQKMDFNDYKPFCKKGKITLSIENSFRGLYIINQLSVNSKNIEIECLKYELDANLTTPTNVIFDRENREKYIISLYTKNSGLLNCSLKNINDTMTLLDRSLPKKKGRWVEIYAALWHARQQN